MFNCCIVNTARSCGRLEKCIICRMNCGWTNCIRKTENYPVCRDSLYISDTGNWVHLNRVTHALTGWKYPAQSIYFTFRHYFPKSWQESWSWSLHQLSSVPVLQHTGHGAQGDVVACHWSYRILTKTSCGTACQCHSWVRDIFLDWRSRTQLCAGPPLSVIRGTRESVPEFKDSKW